jgi:SAM-dependent methyltransferase
MHGGAPQRRPSSRLRRRPSEDDVLKKGCAVTKEKCPNCGGTAARIFHHVRGVPVNSCLMFTDRERARSVPSGDIDLAYCPDCTFIFNAAWRPELTVYSDLYEETQGFSATFNAFHRQLAEELVGRYDLSGKKIVEIGCGKGEFLTLLCELGGNDGTGYDPSFVPARRTEGTASITFKREFFTEATVQPAPDLVCCKMTLEHIFETRRFVQAVRRIASTERGTIVFFQVPDVRRILSEGAFWDVYYEHCSYFSRGSLRHLFRNAGFEVLRVSGGYDDQYLTIEARPAMAGAAAGPADDATLQDLAEGVDHYARTATASAADWAARIRATAQSGGRTVLWGSGSKAVAFLSAVQLDREIEYLVDINPHRRGKFVPGTGKEIVAPEFLAEYQPDLVIAMNPIYRAEIAHDLDRLGCRNAVLCALGEPTVEPLAVGGRRIARLRA